MVDEDDPYIEPKNPGAPFQGIASGVTGGTFIWAAIVAAVMWGLAMTARYSTTAPGWRPFSNAQWFKAIENGTLLTDAKAHIAQSEAMEDV